MRILLIAPDQPKIDSIPEIRTLTNIHRVQVLNGKVTFQHIYDAVSRSKFHVIHFATHGSSDGVSVSADEDGKSRTLRPEDILNIVTLSGAVLVFINACETSGLASFLVSRGVKYVIYANEKVLDEDAWTFPVTFYQMIETQLGHESGDIDVPNAYMRSDSGDGTYGINLSMHELVNMPKLTDILELRAQIDLLQRSVFKYQKAVKQTAFLYFATVLAFMLVLIIHFMGVY